MLGAPPSLLGIAAAWLMFFAAMTAFISSYLMEARVYREDAELPESFRVPPGDWRGLLIFWYFKRHGFDRIMLTFLISITLAFSIGIIWARS
jgi:hypothetical protein